MKYLSILISWAMIAAFGLATTSSSAATPQYPNPNGSHWLCDEYKSYYAWNCISDRGFLYGGIWAFASEFYQHPNPDTDYVVTEGYLNQNGPNGMTQTAQWKHRIIAVNDKTMRGLIEPFRWIVNASQTNPPAPTQCLVLTGKFAGQVYNCTPLDQKSILDYWDQAAVIPNQVAW